MPRLIALKEVRYAGVNCVPGTKTEQFEASETDAVLLKAIGNAKDAPTDVKAQPAPQSEPPPPVEPPAAGLYGTMDMNPDESETHDKPRRPGRYRRRDLTAEE